MNGVLLTSLTLGLSQPIAAQSNSDSHLTASTPPTNSSQSTTSRNTGGPSASSSTVADKDSILRQGEGRLFYTTIQIPANAETLYLSGSGASPDENGVWGDMEEQTINTFTKFRTTLEERGWSMADIVQVRAFAVAGEYGILDFDGFNRGYTQFFGTDENPNKPVRSFVQVADLVVEGWLVEIEIRAARTPD